MKHHLFTVLLALICLSAHGQIKTPKAQGIRRHHIGANFVYIPQYSLLTKDGEYHHQYNRLGGDITYRFCILSMLRVGAQFEMTAPQKHTTSSGDASFGLTLDFPIWIKNRVAIAPGIGTNIMPTGGKNTNNTFGWQLQIMARIAPPVALSAEIGGRKMPNSGYRQYPMRIGVNVLL